MKYKKCFLHVDMDAFFASVEQKDHPEWKGKPVIVGGLPGEKRSVVSTASYEARKYGVHSAMPVAQAVKLCPNGIFTHGNYKRYSEISYQIMSILKKYSPDVSQLSIDEASIDLTGTEMLFGSPETIAKKIHDEVFLQTGLTISAGLASNAYLAKLASEMNKPNGFYKVEAGKEEDFMLALPLKKVWGIGSKTLEQLNRKGFYTTKDIHDKPVEILKMMLGENTGTFLFNTVRGIETELIHPTSHSISNETTFPVDITDYYTAETALMELCHSIMFRLLHEKSFSKTVMVKIRYDDFTTVSIRETFLEYISSLDDLFEKVRSLFEKKYEFGRGIRLLGVGFENVQDENIPRQEVLFDFGEKKKQAVENAILKLSAKHPEIQVKKARLLDSEGKIKAVLLAGLLMLVSGTKTQAENTETIVNASGAGAIDAPMIMLPLPKEAPTSLFDYTIKSRQIDFLAQGWWQGDLTGSVSATKPENEAISISTPDFVFKQQVDLTFWFMLNKQWYFETSFADEFNRNTIAAGFYGKETNPLKHFRIANRGISFPDTYSISIFNRGIGGGENQAPGLFAQFKDPVNSKWKADVALRYEMTQQRDAVFYGKNSVSTKTVELNSYISNQFFVLPENSSLIRCIKNIYVSDSSGTYRDSYNRKYKKIPSDSFLTLEKDSMLIISKDAVPKSNGRNSIAIQFEGSPDFDAILGSYADQNSFLGKIQQYFGDQIDLQKYAFKYSSQIDGNQVLFIQDSAGFSPFVIADKYDLGIAGSARVNVSNKSTEEISSEYAADTTVDFEAFMSSSFVNEKHAYAQVYDVNSSNSLKKNYEPQNRYPLAKTAPGIYLNYSESTDLALLVQTFSPVTAYSIGTKASAGSVRVYINGIPDNSAKYDSDSGTVNIVSTVSDFDKIYITWQEDSGTAESGAIAGQAGIAFNLTKNLSMDYSLAANWTVSPYTKYAEYNRSSSGYISTAAGISYKTENILLSNAVAATIENKNVTGRYRIDGFENRSDQTLYLSKSSLFYLPENFSPQLNNINQETSEAFPELDSENNFTVTANTASVTDSLISGFKAPLEWNFSSDKKNSWASVNIKLNAGNTLANCRELRFALNASDYVLQNYKFYLQLGVDASDEPDPECTDRIPSWQVTDFSRDSLLSRKLKDADWHTATIHISNAERSLLSEKQDARLIVYCENPELLSTKNETVYFGPYELVQESIFTSSKDFMNVSTEQEKDNSIPEKSIFNTENNIVQKIKWDSSRNISEESEISACRYFKECDISRYKYIIFYFKPENFSKFEFILDRKAESIEKNGETAAKVVLSQEAVSRISENKNVYHKFSVNLLDNKVELDGAPLSNSEYSLYLDKNVLPSRMKITFLPVNKSGEFTFDELHLEGISTDIIMEDIAKVEFQKKGDIINILHFPILGDLSFKSRNNAGISSTISDEKNNSGFVSSTTTAGITLAGLEFDAKADLSSKEKKVLTSASHSVKTAVPFFYILSGNDSFVFNTADYSAEKTTGAKIDLRRLYIPLTVSASTESSRNRWAFTDKLSADSDFSFRIKDFAFSLKAHVQANQKNHSDEEKTNRLSDYNYFEAYRIFTEESFNPGSKDAVLRKVLTDYSLKMEIPFISLSPNFCYSLQEKYTNTSSAKYINSHEIAASIPFTVSRQRFNLKYSRKIESTEETTIGGHYKSDFQELFDSYSDKEFFYSEPVFYDIFHKNLADDICEKTKNLSLESAGLITEYGINWKRPVFASIKDLYIPTNFDFNLQRQIYTASDTSDLYILKSSIINTPFNLFGKQSKSKLFNWYNTDEYVISFTGTAKIPADSPQDTIFTIGAYIQSGIYLNSTDILKTGLQYSIETDSSWNAKGTVLYKRKVLFTPIATVLTIFAKADKTFVKMYRTDSFDADLKFDSEKSRLTQDYVYQHLLNIELTSFVTLNTGFGTELKITPLLTAFTLSGSVGGKITF